MLERRTAIATLLANRPADFLIVPGLGSTTWDLASVGDNERDFYLWGAMGGAAMVGLGIALAQPDKRVIVITGDGEMLMGLGSLATIALQCPANLAVVVFDNGHYGETGMQLSHADKAVDLTHVARSCGFKTAMDVVDETSLATLAEKLTSFRSLFFARVKIIVNNPPRVLPLRDGVKLKERFRRAVGVKG